VIVGADLPVAGVFGHDDEDIGLLLLLRERGAMVIVTVTSDASKPSRMFLLIVNHLRGIFGFVSSG
jgi:hypothetical protein